MSCDLWPVQAKITKFGQEVQNMLVKIPKAYEVNFDLQGQI